MSSGDSVPRPLGFAALMPIPVHLVRRWGSALHRTPAWSWPRSRRSACFPAEAYPPLRSLVVYPQRQSCATGERKRPLTIAALSDMADNARLQRAPLHRGQGPSTTCGRRVSSPIPAAGTCCAFLAAGWTDKAPIENRLALRMLSFNRLLFSTERVTRTTTEEKWKRTIRRLVQAASITGEAVPTTAASARAI
jgi:hypothetical protein